MAHVSGPVSTLPGFRQPVTGCQCDEHPDRPAVLRVQGETDSMGAEYADLCAECVKAMSANSEPDIGTCAWCKADGVTLRPRRDMDEGLHGPVYYVCAPCIVKDNEAHERELEQYAEEYGGFTLDEYRDAYDDDYDPQDDPTHLDDTDIVIDASTEMPGAHQYRRTFEVVTKGGRPKTVNAGWRTAYIADKAG